MDPKALELLEYAKILQMLAGETSTGLGLKKASALLPTNARDAGNRQKTPRELLEILNKRVPPSIPGAADVTSRVLAAGQGVVLTGADLKDILDVLLAVNVVSRWLKNVDFSFDALKEIENRFPDVSEIINVLQKTIDENGEVKDSASTTLSSIRKSIRQFQERIRRRAEEITRKKEIIQYLQEPIVTIRNDRYVIPVKQEYASKIPGLVHDQSSSGQTLFVEPTEIVEMGNQLRRLTLQERDEIERIFEQVSSIIGENSKPLLAGMDALGDFDLALAKARLAIKWNGCFPEITEELEIILVNAWHPLLTGKPVPLDIALDAFKSRTIIITGLTWAARQLPLRQ